VSRREQPPQPEFFIDRSLGKKHLAEALRALGFTVHTLSSVYGEKRGQRAPDADWLRTAGRNGWIVLMKDDRIRTRPSERDALQDAQVRAFCLTNAQLRGAEQTARFVKHINRIVQRARKPGPFIYGVYDDGLRRLWPPS
jgi:uncharacterized protein with PIN domain